ncbi:MAG: RDD family protein [Elusimicrobiaceae bacterium]|nr:RDD family protein [Elusimicrobiaceae bacterium]
MKKPSFWRLLVANTVDLLVLLILNICWLSMGWSPLLGIKWFNDSAFLSMTVGITIFFLINAGYFALFEKNGSASLGKRMVGLRISPSLSIYRVLVAYIVDWIPLVAITWGFIAYFGTMGVKYDSDPIAGLLGIPCGIFLIWIYFSILEGYFGKTLGKKLMGLQVVQQEIK